MARFVPFRRQSLSRTVAITENAYRLWDNPPSENECREMIQSSNKYQIARTCAAAGYVNLYRDLVRNHNLLPEVNVLFEAHDSGCKEIYTDIVDNEQVYTAMDDYIEQFHSVPQKVDYWYSDTVTAKIKRERSEGDKYVIDGRPRTELSTRLAKLMDKISNNQPLPRFIFDDKDILILYAAYNGHVDVHLKLRRINSKNEWLEVENEINCVIHSIHNSDLDVAKGYMEKLDHEWLKTAISAKLIMNNDLSFIRDRIYCIWYPQTATEETYRKLVQMHPEEKYIVGRACAVAGYTKLYRELNLEPEISILREAKANKHQLIVSIIDSDTRPMTCVLSDGWHVKYPTTITYDLDHVTTQTVDQLYEGDSIICEDDGTEITSEDIDSYFYYNDVVGDALVWDGRLKAKLLTINSAAS
ncbi:hypothetical protein GQ42DRAFT_31475 [Ramicandelaber brevisporus]|nr:hypothetical protein GQ42DRAFT_31475 [Ramicandelaber brevisporus]